MYEIVSVTDKTLIKRGIKFKVRYRYAGRYDIDRVIGFFTQKDIALTFCDLMQMEAFEAKNVFVSSHPIPKGE